MRARLRTDGFVFIKGRAKRFAKIGGEMVSLPAVEDLADKLWPGHGHAAVTVPDARKGERLVLVTDYPEAGREALAALGRELVLAREAQNLLIRPPRQVRKLAGRNELFGIA